MALEIEMLGSTMAAAVTGADLSALVDDETASQLRRAVPDHLVICIRNQHLSPRQLASTGRVFGPLKTFMLRGDRIEEAPKVSVV